MGADRVVIGNVTFNTADHPNARKINEGATCMSGQLWEVETDYGTFRFRDFENGNHKQSVLNDDLPTILGGKISNCNIKSVTSKPNSERFSVSNSFVDDFDIKDGNDNTVLLDEHSIIKNLKKDNNDKVRTPGEEYNKNILNIEM